MLWYKINIIIHWDVMCQNLLTIVDSLDVGTCLNMTGVWSNGTQMCAEGFYLENDSDTMIAVCTPLCNFWISASRFTTAEDVIFVISMFVAIVSSVILFIVALCFQRDTM